MAVSTALPGLLATITDSLTSAASSLPAPLTSLLPQADGISLLDTKNDLLLSYLQALVFLIALKLRNVANGDGTDGEMRTIGDQAVHKLIEVRAYLERGVRPLEGRLKYQIEKVLRAADEAERSNAPKDKGQRAHNGKISNGTKDIVEGSDVSDSESDSTGSEGSASSNEAAPKIDDLSYRPNPSALLPKPEPSKSSKSSTQARSNNTNAYKPPRITPTSMPDHPSANTTLSRSSQRKRKSHLLDEYISTELSTAPHAEPSIGSNSTILNRGRGALSTRERAKERERKEYEERNFSRLPKESKAERRKQRMRGEGEGGRDRFGGEDWTGLGEMGDRVARGVGRGREKGSVLERREKRRRDEGISMGANGGVGIGEAFEKKRKILEGRATRKKEKRKG